MKNIPGGLLIISLLIVNAACTQPKKQNSPPGYDLAAPKVYNMPPVLTEISGITFLHGNADTIFAEQDEEGKLFYFHLGDTEVKHTKFGKKGDYEDVAICNGQVIMLRSDGLLFTFPVSEIHNKDVVNIKEQPGLLPDGEYESLYADEQNNSIYLLCKNCSSDKQNQSMSGHVLKVAADGQLTTATNFSVDTKGLNAERKINFKPSAMAKNLQTNEWYIVSSVNKMLLVTDSSWKVKSGYPLNAALFTQPEGISFDNNNNLYISNEAGDSANGTILQFLLQKK